MNENNTSSILLQATEYFIQDVKILINMLPIVLGFWLVFGHNSIAEDFVEKYEIASHHGSAIDRCVQAGLVAAAYLQEKNEEKYTFWKRQETTDCFDAGIR